MNGLPNPRHGLYFVYVQNPLRCPIDFMLRGEHGR